MSLPPSLVSDPTRSESAGSRKFGAFPVWTVLSMVLLSVLGAATIVYTATARVSATCGGRQMGPGDICETVNRARIVTDTRGYAEVLADAQRMHQAAGYIGIAVMVLGVLLAVIAVVRWRQDVTLKSKLTDQHGPPISEHSRTASGNFLMIGVGAAFAGGAVYFTMSALAKSEPLRYLPAGLVAALAVAALVAGLPRNGTLIQTYQAGLRVASNGKLAEVAWENLQYVMVVDRNNNVEHRVSGPDLKQLRLAGLTDQAQLLATVATQTSRERLPAAMNAVNNGQTLSFGAFFVSRDGIANEKKVVSWAEYAGIAIHRGKAVVSSRSRGKALSARLARVSDYPLLLALASSMTNSAAPPSPSQ